MIIEKQFNDGGKCVEPEESTRQTARRLIAQMVEVQTPGTKLNISAYGSQSFDGQSNQVIVFRWALRLT